MDTKGPGPAASVPPEGTGGSAGADEPVPESVLSPGCLPPYRLRHLPEPVPFRRMVGPSVMLAGLALGSGEFILWPYITYESGFVFFWACLLGVATQYFLNMEITRWSLATGESAITGFARLSPHWAWVFLLLNVIPWMVPGWSRGAAELLSWLLWGAEVGPDGAVRGAHVDALAIAGLLGCGAVLTAGPVVYETVERVQLVLVGLVMALVVGLAVWLVRPDAVVAQIEGAVGVGRVPGFTEQLTPAVLLGALAFAGVGGTLNLGQSNYVKDKGWGMGRYIGRITSPITGQEEAISEIGYHFPHDAPNLNRWRLWWRSASLEHFVSFFCTCLVCLVLLTLISYTIFYEPDGTLREGAGRWDRGLGFIWGQGEELRRLGGSLLRGTFLVMGVAILLTTEFGVLDAATRVSTDIVKVHWLRESSFWTESRLYYAFLWMLILCGSTIIYLGTDRVGSFALFKFSAAMNGGVMFIYAGLLLWLNRRILPPVVRAGRFRSLVLVWAVAFFGLFAFWAGGDVVWKLLGSG